MWLPSLLPKETESIIYGSGATEILKGSYRSYLTTLVKGSEFFILTLKNTKILMKVSNLMKKKKEVKNTCWNLYHQNDSKFFCYSLCLLTLPRFSFFPLVESFLSKSLFREPS